MMLMERQTKFITSFCYDVNPARLTDFDISYKNVTVMRDFCMTWGNRYAPVSKIQQTKVDALLTAFPILSHFIPMRTKTVIAKPLKKRRKPRTVRATTAATITTSSIVYIGIRAQASIIEYNLQQQIEALHQALKYADMRLQHPEEVILAKFFQTDEQA